MSSPILGLSSAEWKVLKSIFNRLLPLGTTLYVYGSRSRGDHKKYSDLDISLNNDTAISSQTIDQILESFDRSDLTFKLDLSTFSDIDQSFQNHIKENSICVKIPL